MSLLVPLSLPLPHRHSNELSASVCGFPNNIYRCCESVEEGQHALDKYLLKWPSTSSASPLTTDKSELPVAKPTTPGTAEHSIPDARPDESWWCCFAGAKPGVYMGLYVVVHYITTVSDCHHSNNLRKAHPALGGVRPAASEEDGWVMWTKFLLAGGVVVIPQPGN